MWQQPDKRVWPMFGAIFALAILHGVEPFGQQGTFLVEVFLYVVSALFALRLGFLSVQDGHSLLRPSIDRDSSPVMFWLDIGIGCFFFGAVMVWKAGRLIFQN
jgi:hypothetical protein